jgi:lysozyme family protein
VYRLDYWKFDAIHDARLAIKLFDIVVNIGEGIRVIQRAAMVKADGIYGPRTEAALLRLDAETAIERLCEALADHYVAVCLRDPSQLEFLKGWMRRAVRRPHVGTRAA